MTAQEITNTRITEIQAEIQEILAKPHHRTMLCPGIYPLKPESLRRWKKLQKELDQLQSPKMAIPKG